MKDTIITTAGTIIAAIIMFAAVMAILTRVDAYMKLKAIDDCGRISKYEQTDAKKGTTVSFPVADMYKTCLQDKGIK